MEELCIDFNLEDLELIKKLGSVNNYQFPAVFVGESGIWFNYFASPIVPNLIKWFSTGEYIIGLPGGEGERDCFKTHYVDKAKCSCKATTFPADMKSKKIKKGYYKVYKFKDGFAFKRYEPLEVKN